MAKKTPEKDKEAHYKSIIQKQKRIIQDLKKKTGRADKLQERYIDLEEREASLQEGEAIYNETKKASDYDCPRCGGSLDVIDGALRKVFVCHTSGCGYRASTRVAK